VLVAADYCQLELRILGALSRDRRLATVLAKEDPFEWMAQLFAGEEEEEMAINIGREKAKRVGKPMPLSCICKLKLISQLCYAIIYGMGAENLGKELRMPGGADEARQLLNRFFQLFPRSKHFRFKTIIYF
jgi:DNA polymerase I-like protein with 3'-5' exonuclease and polymerase domains